MSEDQQAASGSTHNPSRESGSINIQSLTKIYDPDGEHVTALEEIDLRIEAGEFVSLVGPSGCGKSTLLECIAGFIEPTYGQVHVDGKEITGPGADRGVVFQENRLLPWKTIRENIDLGPKMRGSIEDGRAEELLAKMGIEGTGDQYPTELSGGMQQRAEIARLLANNPEIMLMDEPFSALDALTKEIMQELLLDIWEEDNRTVVFITHDVEEAIFLADRVLIMTAGPGQIKETLEVDLERPRNLDVTTTPRFNELKEVAMNNIVEEARKAMENEQ